MMKQLLEKLMRDKGLNPEKTDDWYKLRQQDLIQAGVRIYLLEYIIYKCLNI